jgi:hypothetical protein
MSPTNKAAAVLAIVAAFLIPSAAAGDKPPKPITDPQVRLELALLSLQAKEAEADLRELGQKLRAMNAELDARLLKISGVEADELKNWSLDLETGEWRRKEPKPENPLGNAR